ARVGTSTETHQDYPMTSTLSAEHTTVGTRARLIMIVFSFLGLGTLAAGIVFVVLLAAFKTAVESNISHLEWVWRLLFGLGVIPAAFTLYARLQMKETRPYEKYVATETSLAGPDTRNYGTQIKDFKEYFSQWMHAKVLFATSATWFLFDIASYGIGLNQSIVLKDIGFGSGKTPFEKLWNPAIGNVIVQLAFWSCLGAGIIYAIWAGVSKIASSGALITLFVLSQFVMGLGPNMTTFLLPVELFPTRVRGTAHGISAASGKVGAVLTAYAFGSVVDSLEPSGALGLFAGIMGLAALVTLWIPEARGKTLEEIENDILYSHKVGQDSSSDPEISVEGPVGIESQRKNEVKVDIQSAN
ncbi:hypothetical protein N7486_006214, partial [Penicillium sp. IBT 16267x]